MGLEKGGYLFFSTILSILEVKEGTEWIEKDLSFEKDRYVNLFETTIRVLGGLLSSFHLTGNKVNILFPCYKISLRDVCRQSHRPGRPSFGGIQAF